jgi:hypothetical protein
MRWTSAVVAHSTLILFALASVACCGVRRSGGASSACDAPCSSPCTAGQQPAVPLPMAPYEPPAAEARAAPCPSPTSTLAPTPAGSRPAWSAAADPDLASLPADVAVEAARPWTVIVVHHSATERGGAAAFDKMHKDRGWDGIGYDFVIGNGTDTKDGEIEVTFRWREQKDGAHAKGWNDVGIGICLVGNFENTDPTPAQGESLVRLLRHLRRRFGVPPQRIVRHGAVGTTLCPGKRLLLAEFVAASAP